MKWGFQKVPMRQAPREFVQKNLEAARRGYEAADALLRNGKIQIALSKHNEVKDEILIDGVEVLNIE